jgi:hypothetical protein
MPKIAAPGPAHARGMRIVWLLVAATACGSAQRADRVPELIRVDGLARPESVLWDPDADVYLVSNIAGEPFAADDNGFIARIASDGRLIDRWIDGAAADVTLDAPRGMAVIGDRLLVADLAAVRVFDRRTGAPRGAIEIPGARLLNDLAVRGDRVIATDSGLPAAKQPADAQHGVYEVDPATGSVAPLLVAPDLGRPGGIAIVGDEIWIATYGTGELFRICDGAACDREALPAGGLDGIVVDGDTWYVSSWDGEAIFAGRPGGAWTKVIEGVPGSADIGWDARRRRLLIPRLEADAVELRPMP